MNSETEMVAKTLKEILSEEWDKHDFKKSKNFGGVDLSDPIFRKLFHDENTVPDTQPKPPKKVKLSPRKITIEKLVETISRQIKNLQTDSYNSEFFGGFCEALLEVEEVLQRALVKAKELDLEIEVRESTLQMSSGTANYPNWTFKDPYSATLGNQSTSLSESTDFKIVSGTDQLSFDHYEQIFGKHESKTKLP